MPIYMPEERPRELPPPGAHTAVCFRVVDLGTQQTPYGTKRQIYIGWELPDERMGNGQPFTIGRYYTYSSDERATLRADIQGWLGRPLSNGDFGKFDLTSLLGATCLIGISHETKNDRTRAAIASVMRPNKGTPTRLPLINNAIMLSLNDRPFDYRPMRRCRAGCATRSRKARSTAQPPARTLRRSTLRPARRVRRATCSTTNSVLRARR